MKQCLHCLSYRNPNFYTFPYPIPYLLHLKAQTSNLKSQHTHVLTYLLTCEIINPCCVCHNFQWPISCPKIASSSGVSTCSINVSYRTIRLFLKNLEKNVCRKYGVCYWFRSIWYNFIWFYFISFNLMQFTSTLFSTYLVIFFINLKNRIMFLTTMQRTFRTRRSMR